MNQTRLDRMRVYIMPRVILALSTSEDRPLGLSLQLIRRKFVDFRDNYYGRVWFYEMGLNARLAGRTKLELRGQLFREYFMDGKLEENRSLTSARIGHHITPKLRVRLLAQFNNDNRRSSTSIRSSPIQPPAAPWPSAITRRRSLQSTLFASDAKSS